MLNKLEFSKEKLAQKERQIAWREMAKQVAHEIKNPLTPMKLSVQHLSRLLESSNIKDKRTLHDFQTKMIQQINLLTEIADEFSNYADLPKGKMKEINLLLVLKKLINLFKYESKVNFKINAIKKDSCLIFGDENQLIRVFNNLIQNSLQAMNYQGEIEINFANDEKILNIDFIDTGPGIGQEIQGQIFEPKFTTKSQGKGLGLALVKQILDNHNASISLLKTTSGAHFLLSFESYEPKN